jgi:hypothetical protein
VRGRAQSPSHCTVSFEEKNTRRAGNGDWGGGGRDTSVDLNSPPAVTHPCDVHASVSVQTEPVKVILYVHLVVPLTWWRTYTRTMVNALSRSFTSCTTYMAMSYEEGILAVWSYVCVFAKLMRVQWSG